MLHETWGHSSQWAMPDAVIVHTDFPQARSQLLVLIETTCELIAVV